MNRALTVLAVGAYLTLLLRLPAERPGLVAGLGGVYTLLATVGFGRLQRHTGPRRARLAAGYVVGQLALGYVLFAASDAGLGAMLLLIVLVSQSVLVLPLWAAALVTATGPLLHVGMSLRDGLPAGLGTLASFVFAAVVTELLRREQRARVRIAEANARLSGYAAQAERLATTEERNRLAREIHDGLGHHLTVVQMQVQAARAVLPTDPERAEAVLAKAQQKAVEALDEVRRSVAALREPRLVAPLPDALAELVAEATAAGLPTELTVLGTPRPLSGEARESLFRVAQEGLTNVRNHARAERARLVLDYGRPDRVALHVRDDGVGLKPAADPPAGTGFGLVGLRERADRMGGSLVLEPNPGPGRTLRVELPG